MQMVANFHDNKKSIKNVTFLIKMKTALQQIRINALKDN